MSDEEKAEFFKMRWENIEPDKNKILSGHLHDYVLQQQMSGMQNSQQYCLNAMYQQSQNSGKNQFGINNEWLNQFQCPGWMFK